MESASPTLIPPFLGVAIVLIGLALLAWFAARRGAGLLVRFLSAVPGVLAFTAYSTVFSIDAGLSIIEPAKDMAHNWQMALLMIAGNGLLYFVVWSVIFALISRHGASGRRVEEQG